jgi:hypothetical protein
MVGGIGIKLARRWTCSLGNRPKHDIWTRLYIAQLGPAEALDQATESSHLLPHPDEDGFGK